MWDHFGYSVSSFSQVCYNDERYFYNLPVDTLGGYFSGFAQFVPGVDINAKSDSCINKLVEQFPNQFDGIDLKVAEAIHLPWFSTIEYKQYVNDILIGNRGVVFQFDPNGLLLSISIYLECDSIELLSLEQLATGGNSHTHTIEFIENNYELKLIDPGPVPRFLPPKYVVFL
jgi:hypothetical protein